MGLVLVFLGAPGLAAELSLSPPIQSLVAAHPRQTIEYRLEPVPEDPPEAYSPEQLEILEKLNRTDAERLARQERIVVPSRWDADELQFSPIPHRVSALAGELKALVVHQPLQVFGAYEDGELVRWGPVSSGRLEHPTPPGRHNLTWRSRGRHSTVNPEWYLEWYFNFHNERGISFHQYELPGEPASHACIRLLERDARWIYEWGEGWTLDDRGWEVLEEGTPVWIVDEYDYDSPPPWLDPENPPPEIERFPLDENEPLRTGAGQLGPSRAMIVRSNRFSEPGQRSQDRLRVAGNQMARSFHVDHPNSQGTDR